METIPPIYWMIVVTAVVGMICFVLYELGMLIKESRNELGMLIKDSRRTLGNIEGITSTVKGTVDEVNDAIIKPIRGIGSGLSAVSGFVSGLRGEERE